MKFSAKYRFGSSNRLPPMRNEGVPGPGNYGSTLIDKRNAPKFGFGSSTREGTKDMNVTFPGPGSYKLGTVIGKDGPGIQMHSKLNSLSKLETPGPG